MRLLTACMAVLFAVANSYAGIITYRLDDHSDGNQTPPYEYGLRLDSQNLFLTFNKDNGSKMFAEWDTTNETFRIFGTALESLGNGVFGDTYEIEFTVGGTQGTLSGLSGFEGASWEDTDGLVGSVDGSVVQKTGTGTLSTYSLSAKRDSTGFAMDFYNDDFRKPDNGAEFVGRGWVFGGGTNDFLFTANVVPEPSTAMMLLLGIGSVGLRRRRR